MDLTETPDIADRFARLATDHAPGQENRHPVDDVARLMRGETMAGRPVDFSHGDVDAFPPPPDAARLVGEAITIGGAQAYTEYRGAGAIRETLAGRLATFTGARIDPEAMILTPGTQGALFLAVASCVGPGDAIAIADPDYFANWKIPAFLGARIMPVTLDYDAPGRSDAGLDLAGLEAAFRAGAKTFLFSNPNNPTGVTFSGAEITAIAALANRFGVTVICDQLYSRLQYRGTDFHHLCAEPDAPDSLVTIMGPSKTESLSGFRLGVAFGTRSLIERMEKLQAIVSLRAGGYAQRVLLSWFAEPEGWMAGRIAAHEAIRDDLVAQLRDMAGVRVRTPQAGSYLFPELPALDTSSGDFVRLLRAQAGVIVTPGSEFSRRKTAGIRFNYSQDHAAAVAAMTRVCAMIARYRSDR
ncbi:pyridoxal phosphate-dependent aminotransferase [Acuticoccus sp. M5D2P5]|uniref:pyridoxal phosphate-dependent aminotransferase n=1 Tax=Acuticoccus kalidii TaxID=2910977 RepID=UPI001F2053E7|nr:pyridoxal phosphate-dependent aminotransferase [Acuticoccus kalidii]MCF3934709.1 pyridoxal phosphate-dependent aminotransferase [Acuticoccus kalidii]